jgi:hypothetical protein
MEDQATSEARPDVKPVTAPKMPCPHCGKNIRFLPEQRGIQARCPHCRQNVILQEPAQLAAVALTPPPPPPPPPPPQAAIAMPAIQHLFDARSFAGELKSVGAEIVRAIGEQCGTIVQKLEEDCQARVEPLRQLLDESTRLRQAVLDERNALAAQGQAMTAGLASAIAQIQATQEHQGQQLARLTDSMAQTGQSIQTLAAALDRCASAVAQSAESLAAEQAKARAEHASEMAHVREDMARAQGQIVAQLAKVAGDFAHDAQAVGRQIADAANVQSTAAGELRQRLAGVEGQVEASARRQIDLMASGAQQVVSNVGQRLGESLGAEMDKAARTACDHLAATLKVGREMVDRLVSAEQRASQQIAALAALVEGHNRLDEMQRALAWNLELVSRSEDFKQVLKGIDQGLYALKNTAELLRVRIINSSQPPAPATGDVDPTKPGLGKRLLRGLGLANKPG